MSDEKDQPKITKPKANQGASKSNSGNGVHQCPSWTSFRTATPDSTFGHDLQRVARPVTRDPTADMKKCASTASIRTLASDTEFGANLHRCARRTEQPKEGGKPNGEEAGPGSEEQYPAGKLRP